MTIYEHVERFVRKCGGKDKLAAARMGLANLRGDYAGFIKRVARSEAGAKQLVASALLGYVLAEIVLASGESTAVDGDR